MTDVRAIIADDHPLFRAAMTQAARDFLPGGQVLDAADIDQLWALLKQYPDTELVFMDLLMPGSDGFAALSALRADYPDVTVIMISALADNHTISKAMALGAMAFVPKSAPLPVLGQAIRQVLDGEQWLPRDTQLDTTADTRRLERLAKLTPQQYRVLKMIADGLLNKQIAFEMSVQETTVKQHVSAILRKLEVNNRTQAGLFFQELKSLPQELEEQAP